MKRIIYTLVLLSIVFVSACKSSKNSNPNPSGPSKNGTTLQLIQDSIYLYASEDYLWYNSLPNYQTFNPRGFTGADDKTTLTNEVNALSQYAINPTTSLPYEYYAPSPGDAKYSFIDDGTVSSELNGVRGDFGFSVFYNLNNDLRIKYVYPGSPADLAGIKRGYQITSINGNTNLTYDGGNGGSGTNLNFIINAIFNSNTITSMALKKPDGSTLNVSNISVANYNVNPVLYSNVYTQPNGHKVGYIVFNSFTSPTNANPKLDPIFANFATQGITDLVIDLRYNGGGYVATAEHIDNLIVPAAKSGTLMYATYYNDILTNKKQVLLKNQWRKDASTGQTYNYGQFSYAVADNSTNFSKIGTLNVNRVFFIITGSTASASELTINNLRPFMDVQLIGRTSYGKPVGFFDIDINKYELYIPEFYTQNSAGQGGYYSGFTPGAPGYPGVSDYDDVTKDFGDPTEKLLAHALNYVQNGTYTVKNQVIQSTPSFAKTLSLREERDLALKFERNKFNGMIIKGNPRVKR